MPVRRFTKHCLEPERNAPAKPTPRVLTSGADIKQLLRPNKLEELIFRQRQDQIHNGERELPGYRSEVVCDPMRSFGRPIFVRTGVCVDDLIARFQTGESIEGLTEALASPTSRTRCVSHPDGLPDLFLDRSLGRKKVPEMLRAEGLRLGTLAEHYGIPHDETIQDTEWLHLCGEREWLGIMKDDRIRYVGAAREAASWPPTTFHLFYTALRRRSRS